MCAEFKLKFQMFIMKKVVLLKQLVSKLNQIDKCEEGTKKDVLLAEKNYLCVLFPKMNS